MKFVYILILLCLSSSAVFSQASERGGQDGNGGNGCYNGGRTVWRSFEEIEFNLRPERVYRDRGNGSWNNQFQVRNDRLPKYDSDYVYNINLLYKQFAKNALTDILTLRHRYPKSEKILRKFYRRFSTVTVSQKAFVGVFGSTINPDRDYRCNKFAPALFTRFDGEILLSRPVWNRTMTSSLHVIMIHETLRLAQMFDPFFKNLSNDELEFLTAHIFINPSADLYILDRIERLIILKSNRILSSNKD